MLSAAIWGVIIWGILATLVLLFVGTGALAWFLVILSAVLCIGGALIWEYLAVRIVQNLAEVNKGFTYVDEGTMKFITLGGEVVGEIEQYAGYYLDDECNVVPDEGEERPREYSVFFGAHWFENPFINAKWVFGYDWRRTVIDENGKPRELSGEVDYVPLQEDVYLCRVTAAETLDLFTPDLELLVTMQVVNPFKALFRTGAQPGVWIQVVTAILQGEATPVMSHREYRDWIVHRDAVGDQLYKRLQGYREIGEAEPDEIRRIEEVHGVKISTIRCLTIKLDEEQEELALGGTRAEIEADVERTRARGRADALKTVTDAMESSGSGRLYQVLETIRNSQPGAAVQAMFIPGFSDLIGGAMRGAETGNTQEVMAAIAKLTAQVEKLQASQTKPDENLEAVGKALQQVEEQLGEETQGRPNGEEYNGYLC